MRSLVVVVPEALWSNVAQFNQLLGYDPGPGIEVVSKSDSAAAYRALHTWVSDSYLDIIQGRVEPDIEGVPQSQISALLSAITISVEPTVSGVVLTKGPHFDYIMNSLSLEFSE